MVSRGAVAGGRLSQEGRCPRCRRLSSGLWGRRSTREASCKSLRFVAFSPVAQNGSPGPPYHNHPVTAPEGHTHTHDHPPYGTGARLREKHLPGTWQPGPPENKPRKPGQDAHGQPLKPCGHKHSSSSAAPSLPTWLGGGELEQHGGHGSTVRWRARSAQASPANDKPTQENGLEPGPAHPVRGCDDHFT